MKKTFLMLLAGIVLAGFTFMACSDDDDDVVKKDDTTTTPDGGGAGDDGSGSGDEGGGTTTTLHESLQGSDYYVLVMDDYTFEEITDKVTLDLRAGWQDEENPEIYHGCELWVWNGYDGGTSSGVNFYGVLADWCSLVVNGNEGWSGLGFCLYLDEDQYAKMAIDDSYYLHLAYKTSQSNISHAVYVVDPSGESTSGFAIGDGGDYNDNGTIYSLIQPDSGEFVTGDWNEYNVAVSSLGLDWSKDWGKTTDELGEIVDVNANILCVLSGGTSGVTLDLDAVFFYKKAE